MWASDCSVCCHHMSCHFHLPMSARIHRYCPLSENDGNPFFSLVCLPVQWKWSLRWAGGETHPLPLIILLARLLAPLAWAPVSWMSCGLWAAVLAFSSSIVGGVRPFFFLMFGVCSWLNNVALVSGVWIGCMCACIHSFSDYFPICYYKVLSSVLCAM